jgi:hypothetical protein
VPGVRNRGTLAAALRDARQMARLFVRLATVVTDIDVGAVDDWEWHGATERFEEVAERIGAPNLSKRAAKLAAQRSR